MQDPTRIAQLRVWAETPCAPDAVFRREGGAQRLRPVQARALYTIASVGGLLAPIGVGYGKTLVCFLAPTAYAYFLRRMPRALLLVPSRLYEKTLRDREEYGRHWVLPPLDILKYELLSGQRYARILDTTDYDLVIADEVHALRNATAARTKRVTRFFARRPEAGFVALSGTLTTRSIRDYAHLSAWALGMRSPLPLTWSYLESFAQALDPDGVPTGADLAALKPVLDRFPGEGRTGLDRRRSSFRLRLVSAPGVVATEESALGTGLELERIDVTPPAAVLEALAHVEATWSSPGGEEVFDSPARLAEYRRAVAQGFYYRWIWPDGAPDRTWLGARAVWAAAVVRALQRPKAGLDSPGLLAAACERDEAPTKALAAAWAVWGLERAKPAPPVEPVWISPWLVERVTTWAHGGKGSRIVWYHHRAMADALEAVGLYVFRPGETPPTAPGGHRPICLSVRAHGEGHNLQSWSESLVICPPSSGHAWEQLLGRTHRPGQEADTVRCSWFALNGGRGPFSDAMRSARKTAEYIETTTGQQQKLLSATNTRTR